MNIRKKGKTRIVLGLVFIIAVFFTGCSNSSTNANSQTSGINRDLVPPPSDLDTLVAPADIENTDQISKENFDKIKNGMSFFEVEIIIAGNSKLISSNVVNGKLNETHRWATADFARYIEVRFVDDKVAAKSQKGLK